MPRIGCDEGHFGPWKPVIPRLIPRLLPPKSMSTDSNAPRSLGAVMSAESGFDVVDDDTPLRISGFISAILGVLSGFTIVALPMVAVAIAAFLFGLFALRKSEGASLPVGTTAARIGIFLAVLFGSWGVGRDMFKSHTLGGQAEYFARQFIKVVATGNEAYANELQKNYVNRYLKTMPLAERYALEAERKRKRMEQEGGIEPDTDEDPTEFLKKYPADHEWILDRPVRVYSKYGRQKADVVFAYDDSEKPTRIRIQLEYLLHRETGNAEWHVELCMPYRERIVAETVL